MPSTASAEQASFGTISPTPEGYNVVIGPDNARYMVPLHLMADLRHIFDSYKLKMELGVGQSLPMIHERQDIPVCKLGEGYATHPPNPPISEDECLSLHADILALQQRYGLSYKDSAHRLYMAEVAKAKTSYGSLLGLSDILKAIDDALAEFEGRTKVSTQNEGSQH